MTRRHRVWHLLSNRWNSAITEYALSAGRALKDRGHTTLFTPLLESPAATRAEKHFETEGVKSFGITELGRLFDLADEFRPDVVFAYGGPETFLASLLKRGRDLKVVRFRGQPLDGSGLAVGLKHRLSHRFVATILTPSDRLAAAVKQLDPSANALCVPLGIDTDHYRPVPAAKPDRPELVIFGRLDPVKGHHVAIKIFARILKTWPDAVKPRLRIVGEPANLSRTHLEHWVEAEGLVLGGDVVLTLGRIQDVPVLLSRSALGWVPSLGSEIICRVAEEFLACGTPVAVSGVGSLGEVLFDGAGVSYEGKDESESAKLISRLLRNALEEDDSAKAARAATARDHYSITRMGELLESHVLSNV